MSARRPPRRSSRGAATVQGRGDGALPAVLFDPTADRDSVAWCEPIVADRQCFGLLVCRVPAGGSGKSVADATGLLVPPLAAALGSQSQRGLSYRVPYDLPRPSSGSTHDMA